MTEKLKLTAELDATGVQKGAKDAKDAVRDLAADVKKQGAGASTALDGMGKSGERSAKQIERDTRSIAASMQRNLATLQAGERGTAAYFEALAKQRGADLSSLAPLIKETRAIEAAQKAASGSLDKIGVSAKQTAAALRGVPAQFTDIITSLQGGQAPLTVLLQQGGQLKDMFGGVGAAARALGGFLVGLVNPYTIAAAAAGGLLLAYKAGAEEASAFQRAVILSGEAAGVTAGQLSDMAARVSAIGAGTQGRAAEILAGIAKSAAVGAADMERFTAAAIRFEQVGGPAAEDTAKAFADLAKSPLEAALKLNQATNFLTASTYQQIKALEEQGRTVEAARVAQEAYATSIETRTPQMLQSLGYVERAWLSIKQAAKDAVDSVLSIGRAAGPQQAATALRNRIASIEAGNEGREGKSKLPDLQAQLAAMEKGAGYEALSAFYASERVAAVKARTEYDKIAEQYADRQKRASLEIAEIERLGLATGRSRVEVEALIAKVREKYADKPSAVRSGGDGFAAERDAAKQWAQAFAGFSAALADADGKTAALTRTQVDLVKFLESPAYQLMGEPARQLALQQAYAAISAERLNEENQAYARSAAEAGKAYAQWRDGIVKGAVGVEQQIDRLETEAKAADLAASSYVSLAQAVEMVEIARLKEQQDAMLGDNVATDAIQREIDARQKLIELIGGRDARDAAARSAKDASDEWQRSSEHISQSLTDALLRGFEAGKDFATTFRDTLVNMFRTLVLKPIIQWVVQPVQDVISGFLGQGLTGGASGSSAAGTVQNASSYLSIGRNLATGFGGLSLAVSNAAATTSANLAGTGLDGMLAANGAYGTAGTGAGWAGTLGSAAGIGAGVLGGVYGGRAISGGYSVNGGSGNSAVNTGTAIGAAVGSIVPVLGTALGALIGGLAGGTVNRLFGRKAPEVTDQGITGTIGGGDFSGQVYRDVVRKGGVFRKDKRYTEMTALPDDLGGYLDKASKQLYDQVTELGKTLGLPVQQLAGISSKIRLTLTADAEKNQQAITEVLKTYTDDLVLTFKDQIEPLRQYGETLAATLSRLSVLQTFSEGLTELGGVFSEVAGLSLAARQGFVDMAGGMEALASKAQTFAQQYYSREEIAGLKARELQNVLAGAGVSASEVGSREDFRRLVDATDVSTQAGRAQLAALLDVAGSFADVADYIAETGSTLAKVAAQAPTAGPAANLLAPVVNVDSTDQVVAINGVESAVHGVAGLLKQLVDIVSRNRSAGFSLEVVRP